MKKVIAVILAIVMFCSLSACGVGQLDDIYCSNCGEGIANNDGFCEKCDAAVNVSTMVWISKTGKKYHRNSGCSNMKNPSQVSKSVAEGRGLTPCSKCW